MLTEFGVNGVLFSSAEPATNTANVTAARSLMTTRGTKARKRHAQLKRLSRTSPDGAGVVRSVPRRLANRGSERVPRRGVVCPVGAVAWNIPGEAVEHRGQGCGVGADGGVF